MANKPSEGPPDLWEIAARLIALLRGRLKTGQKTSGWSQSDQSRPLLESERYQSQQNELQSQEPVPQRKPGAIATPQTRTAPLVQSITPAQKQSSPSPLLARLQNQEHVRQAIVLSEILAKPVAMRGGSHFLKRY